MLRVFHLMLMYCSTRLLQKQSSATQGLLLQSRCLQHSPLRLSVAGQHWSLPQSKGSKLTLGCTNLLHAQLRLPCCRTSSCRSSTSAALECQWETSAVWRMQPRCSLLWSSLGHHSC